MKEFERLLDEDTAPSISAIKKAIGQKNVPAWNDLREYLTRAYEIEPELLFYGKKYGWTYKYRKSSKTLCSLFPEKDAFTVLITLGRKELEKLDPDLPKLSKKMQDLISSTNLLHDGKWLWIRVPNVGEAEDIKTILKAKRKPKLK
jgi:hypothetical protein